MNEFFVMMLMGVYVFLPPLFAIFVLTVLVNILLDIFNFSGDKDDI
jgi:hypothetical protein